VPVKIARRTFNVEDYHRMAEAGILGDDDRGELIEGEIVQMAPSYSWTTRARRGERARSTALPMLSLKVDGVLG
jgi:Uma2 family endonuclease